MEIICGNDKIDIINIENIEIRRVEISELEKIEQDTNGKLFEPKKCFGDEFLKKLDEIITEYNSEIADRLAVPQLNKTDLPSYCTDEDMTSWKPRGYGRDFSFIDFDDSGDGTVLWKFDIEHIEEKTVLKAQRKVKLSYIMQTIGYLINIPKSKIIDVFSLKHFAKEIFDIVLFSGEGNDDKEYVYHTYKQIQKDLPPIYEEYKNKKEKIESRLKNKEEFLSTYKDKFVLIFNLKDSTKKVYLDDFCGFDIFSIFK